MTVTLIKKKSRCFDMAMPKYNQKVLDAMAEAKRISHDPNVKSYTSMEDLKTALEAN